MALKYEIDSLDAVPEALREHYSAGEDGKFRLAAEGVVPKNKLDEFRTNNINLLRERDTLKEQLTSVEEKYKDIDLDEYVKLKQSKGKGAKKGTDEEEIEALLEERTKAMKQKLEGELQTLRQTLSAKDAKLSTVLIDNTIQSAALTAGVTETAIDDVIRRGREIFRLKGDAVVPMQGEHTIYGDDGITPLTVKEWITNLAGSAPHLFKQSQGGGASNSGGSGGALNVKAKADFKNVTEKSKFITEHGMEAYLKLPATR